jgi:branched-chain amino acid transport system permease protein
LASGGVYALLAVGLVTVYRATGLVNFAQGAVAMIAAYAYIETAAKTTSPIIQLLAALSVGAAAGILFFGITHYLLRKATHLAIVIGTVAVGIIFEALARLHFTGSPRPAAPWLFGNGDIRLGSSTLSTNSVVTIAIAVILVATLWAWFRYTRQGKIVSAVAEDSDMAAISGIRVTRVLALSWLIGGGLAAIAGVMYAPVSSVYPSMSNVLILFAFTAALMGGFTSIPGALAGGLLLGALQAVATTIVGGVLRDSVTFAVILLLLVLRPQGLFQARSVRRV